MKKTMIVLSVAVGCLIAFAPTVEAQFPKIPGLGGKKKQKAGGFVVPALAFAIEGAPGDPVEMTFFYADATATLFKAASDHMYPAIHTLQAARARARGRVKISASTGSCRLKTAKA